MSKKQVFAKVGAIIGIVAAALLMFGGVCAVLASRAFTAEFVMQALAEEGMYGQYYTDQLDLILTIAKGLYIVIGLYLVSMGIAQLVLSIKVLKQANANKLTKGSVIVLLVLSALTGNLVVMGFMITTLCLRDKVTVEPTPAGMSFND